MAGRKPSLARRERQAKVLELVEAGASYRAIAARLGISHTQVSRDHDDALREVTLPMAEQVRKIHHARYESVYLLSMAKARKDSDMRAAQVALNTLQAAGKMYGLDQQPVDDSTATVSALLDRLLEKNPE